MITHDDNADRPPIGIKPEWLVKEQRLNDIKDAMARWVVSTYSYPKEWIKEREALEEWLNKNLPSKKRNIMKVKVEMIIETEDFGAEEFKSEIENLIEEIDNKAKLIDFSMYAI